MATPAPQAILPPPPPGSNWQTKILWYLAGTAAHALIYTSFDYGGEIQATQVSEDDPDPSVWMHVQVHYSDGVSQAIADDQVFTLDVINYTGDLVDPTWNDTDFQQAGAAILDFVNAVSPHIASRYTCDFVRFYRRAFNPYSNPKPFADAGGPSHVIAANVPSTGQGYIPPYVSSTVTELTSSRKHWGRFYLPGLASKYGPAMVENFDASGRITPVTVAKFADSAELMAEALAANNFRLVVPTTSSGGTFHPELEGDWSIVPARTIQHVTGFRVDDVADVIRRRRHKSAILREDR